MTYLAAINTETFTIAQTKRRTSDQINILVTTKTRPHERTLCMKIPHKAAAMCISEPTQKKPALLQHSQVFQGKTLARNPSLKMPAQNLTALTDINKGRH